jgi:hypothetical protein
MKDGWNEEVLVARGGLGGQAHGIRLRHRTLAPGWVLPPLVCFARQGQATMETVH